jgi:hypothetical protein
MRRHYGFVTALVGHSNSLLRRRRWTPLNLWYIDIFRQSFDLCLHPRNKLVVSQKNLSIQIAPNRLTNDTLSDELLVFPHRGTSADGKLRKQSICG